MSENNLNLIKKFYLGIDCGLTSIKVIVFDKKGVVIQKRSAKNCVIDGKIETQVLWNKVVECVKQAIEGIENNIAGISVCGHGNGLYFIREGKPHEFAYSSMYNGHEIKDERIPSITLQTVWNGQPLNILSKIKKENLELYESIDKIFFCKDFIRYMLTGNIAGDYTDFSAAGLLDNNSYTVNPYLYSLFKLDGAEKFIPTLYNSYEIAGYISKEIEALTGLKQGTPVATGAFDVCGCMVGAGIKDDLRYAIISGTWGINAALTRTKINDKRITQCCSFIDRNFNVCIESAPTSCVNLEWLLNNVCPFVGFDEVSEIAKRIDTDLIYLPYIYPSMRNPAQKAEFVNLRVEHTYKDMVKAVLEGVAFGHRLQIESLKAVGIERKEVVLSGGATNNDEWCQLYADVLNTNVIIAKEKECGSLGAAIFATVASGEYENIEIAQSQMVSYAKVFKPKKSYNSKYEKFLKIIRRNNGFRT